MAKTTQIITRIVQTTSNKQNIEQKIHSKQKIKTLNHYSFLKNNP